MTIITLSRIRIFLCHGGITEERQRCGAVRILRAPLAVLGLSVWGSSAVAMFLGGALNRNDYRSPTTNYTVSVYVK